MNKYIKTDLEQAVSYMEIAILNAVYDIDSGEEEEIEMSPYLSLKLIHKCLNLEGWVYEGENIYAIFYRSPKTNKVLAITKNKFIFKHFINEK